MRYILREVKPSPEPDQAESAMPVAAPATGGSTPAPEAVSGGASTPGVADKSRLAAPLLVACLVMFTFLTCPSLVTEMNADTSLSAVLQFAADRGTQFGSDLVSTYGPFGSLIFPHYEENGAWLRIVADLAVCYTVALGLCLLAWRLGFVAGGLLLGLFIWAAANVWLRTDLVLHSGLFCWGLLAFVQTGRRLVLSAVAFSAFGAFCALAKVSLLFMSVPGLALLAAHFIINGRWRLAVGSWACFGAVFLFGWMLAGQNPANIPLYLGRAVTVALSYNAALGVEGLQSVHPVGIAVTVLTMAVLVLRCSTALEFPHRLVLRRLLLLSWLVSFVFMAWKHGFVRGDTCHVGFFLGFVPLVILSLKAIPGGSPRTKFWARILGVVCVTLPVLALQIFVFAPLPGSLTQPLALFRSNVLRVFAPGEFAELASQVLETKEREASLPQVRRIVARSAVDVFGQQQAYALLNDLNYRPRPVCQSYAACDARLMRLNEEFFLSAAAPAYWLMQLAPLDRKFAPLEDAWLLRDLLVDCEPVAVEREFLLLRRVSSEAPRLSLLKEGSVEAGQPIDLRQWSGSLLWVELTIEPSFFGRLRQWLYRPPTIRLAAWREPGKGILHRHQAAATMLAAGFLASPLLVRTEDVVNFCYGKGSLQPGAYSVETGEGGVWWRSSIGYRVYRIENALRHRDGEPSAKRQAVQPGNESLAAAEQPGSGRPLSAQPFSVFRQKRWRPALEPPGSVNDILAYGVFFLVPIASGTAGVFLLRHRKSLPHPVTWPWLIAANVLVGVFLLSLSLLAGETYFRFVYDTTDSLAYTRVTEQWVRRHWHVNSAGCRDNIEYQPMLEPGQRRITFVGDSFAAGHGVRNVDDRLANRLRKRRPEWQVHVMANIGLDTGAEVALIRRLLRQGYQLDQVVLVYCLNDIGDLAPDQVEAADVVLANVLNEGWLIRNSYLLNLLYERYQVWRHPYARNYAAYVRGMYSGRLWPVQQERLKSLRDLVQSNGGRLEVVTFPLFHALGPQYPYGFVHQQLNQLWQELQVPHLDLLPTFENLPPEKLVVNPYDAHPNEYANQLAADAVGKFLFDQAAIDKTAGAATEARRNQP